MRPELKINSWTSKRDGISLGKKKTTQKTGDHILDCFCFLIVQITRHYIHIEELNRTELEL